MSGKKSESDGTTDVAVPKDTFDPEAQAALERSLAVQGEREDEGMQDAARDEEE